MSSSRLVTTLWFCSRTAFADLWIEPAGGYFLPRADELPSYGFSYGAQSEQNSGKKRNLECFISYFLILDSYFLFLDSGGTYSSYQPDLELALLQQGTDN